MIKIKLLNFLLTLILICNLLNAQKELRVGYINMDYILSNIEDFEVANKEFEYKLINGKMKF